MILDIVIYGLFLILQALTDMNVKEIMSGDSATRALIFNNDITQFILSSSMIAFTILSVVIFFLYGWQTFVGLFIICYIINLIFFKNLILQLLIKVVNKIDK